MVGAGVLVGSAVGVGGTDVLVGSAVGVGGRDVLVGAVVGVDGKDVLVGTGVLVAGAGVLVPTILGRLTKVHVVELPAVAATVTERIGRLADWLGVQWIDTTSQPCTCTSLKL